MTPVDVPTEFVATSWKRYDVFGSRPVTTVETEVGAEPDPASAVAVEEPSDVVVPYEK